MALGLAIIPVASATDLENEARKRNDEMQAQPVIQGLASHVKQRWESARIAKRQLEERMLKCLRQRNGEYDPDKLAEIKEQGGSEIFIQLSSVKCRAATSWLRDTLLGTGADKPWGLDATPEPTLPPEIMAGLQQQLTQQLMTHMEQGGVPPTEEQLREIASQMKDVAMRQAQEEANRRVDRMERKMEDQLVEGGWLKALNEFLDDIVTFPYAVIKGPIKRKRKTLEWQNGQLVPTEKIRNEWERVAPFYLYWAPWAWELNDGYVIERHRLTADELQALIGVPGYNDDAIRTVLNDFSSMGMKQW